MTHSSKILTVSYGTFSCTLEGYDDTFEAMKEITEYFRALAAEDRYFGVEPPQTQMAQRDAARRMGGTEHGREILLRHGGQASVAPSDATLTGLEELTQPYDMGDADEAADTPAMAVGVHAEESGADEEAPRKSEDDPRKSRQRAEGKGDITARTPEPPPSDLATEPAPAKARAALDPLTAAKLQRIREIVRQEPETGKTSDPLPSESEIRPDDHQLPVEVAETPSKGNERNDRPAPDQQGSPPLFDPHVDQEDLQVALNQLEEEAQRSEDDPPRSAPETLAPVPVEDTGSVDTVGAGESVPEPAHSAPQPQVSGRVLKVDRADLDAALAAGDLKGNGPQRPDTAAGPETPSLSPSEAKLPPVDTRDADDISRLMAEAEQKMEDPDGTTRRDAFAHLRAAVAAQFADNSMQQGTSEEETTQPYRHDLAQAIKPRRPAPTQSRTDRPADPSPAPLKLAPEQRIDDAEANTAPVMPRRVATPPDDDMASVTQTDFAAFAAEWGVSGLPDLLEAAAAHMSFVEGREVFSRPQLMTRVRQADAENFSREEALRGFAQLLQSGKIQKIGSGRFQTSDTIRYRPDGYVADGSRPGR